MAMSVHFGFASGMSIREVILRMDMNSTHNWLFVCVDSLRGEVLKARNVELLRRMAATGLKLGWCGGVWVPHVQVRQAVASHLIIHFNAAYMFDGVISDTDTLPDFDRTSEGIQFREQLPESLIREVKRLGSCGYLSDGVGLNYYVACSRLWGELRGAEWGVTGANSDEASPGSHLK